MSMSLTDEQFGRIKAIDWSIGYSGIYPTCGYLEKIVEIGVVFYILWKQVGKSVLSLRYYLGVDSVVFVKIFWVVITIVLVKRHKE